MTARVQAIILTVVYSLTIVGTLWVSGQVAGRATLYDEYLVALDGNVLQVSDFKLAKKFYTEVLDFRFLDSEGQSHALMLPGEKRIYLYKRSLPVPVEVAVAEHSAPGSFTLLRVRNGIKKLQREIAARSGAVAVAVSKNNVADGVNILPAGRVSEILDGDAGQEFIVKDPDGNAFIFFQHYPFQGAKYQPLVSLQSR